MTNKTFGDIILQANQLAIRLRGITHQYPDAKWTQHLGDLCGERTWGIDELADHLSAIGDVLQIIADTPNGYINQEAMDRLREEFSPAIEFLQTDWAKQVQQEATSRFLDGGPTPKQRRQRLREAASQMYAALEACFAMLGDHHATATGNSTRDWIDEVREQAFQALAKARGETAH